MIFVVRTAAGTLEAFKEHTSHKLCDVLCPDHKQAPRLKFRGESLREVSIQISACCDKLSAMANAAVAGLTIAGLTHDEARSSDPHASLPEPEAAPQLEQPAA